MRGIKVTRNSGRGYELTFYFVGLSIPEARNAADKLVYNDQEGDPGKRYDVASLVYNHLRDAKGNRITPNMVQRTFIAQDRLMDRIKKVRLRPLAEDSARADFEANVAYYTNTQQSKGPTFGDRTHGTHGPAKSRHLVRRRRGVSTEPVVGLDRLPVIRRTGQPGGRSDRTPINPSHPLCGKLPKGVRRQLERVRRQNYQQYVHDCGRLNVTPLKVLEAP